MIGLGLGLGLVYKYNVVRPIAVILKKSMTASTHWAQT